jgi:integrase
MQADFAEYEELGVQVVKHYGKSSYEILDVPFQRSTRMLPLLILDTNDGAIFCEIAIKYSIHLRRIGRSYKHIRLFNSAYGRLYDYWKYKLDERILTSEEIPDVLLDFLNDRTSGTKDSGRIDVTGLNWSMVQPGTAALDYKALVDFSSHCETHRGFTSFKTWDTSFSNQARKAFASQREASSSILFHLKSSRKDSAAAPFSPPSTRKDRRFKSFPPNRVWDLLAAMTNERDTLYFLLLAFGSLRISEPAHMFVQDIKAPPEGESEPIIILGDPVWSKVNWIAFDGSRRTSTRAAYLSQKYELQPRNMIDKKSEFGALHAGFKGVMWDDDPARIAYIHWSDPKAGKEFWRLHCRYLRKYRLGVGDLHPFYFVNINKRDNNYGTPIALSAMTAAFYAAAEKIGLRPTESGVNPHGLRHFYGYYLKNVLGLGLDSIKDFMHHVSIASTAGYARNSKTALRDLFRNAFAERARASKGAPEPHQSMTSIG